MSDEIEPRPARIIPACPECGGGMTVNTPRPGWFGEHLPFYCPTCMQFRDEPDAPRPESVVFPKHVERNVPASAPVTAIVPQDGEGRMLETEATVACIWVKRDGDTLALELDHIEDRLPPERAQLALVLRDLADALEAEARLTDG